MSIPESWKLWHQTTTSSRGWGVQKTLRHLKNSVEIHLVPLGVRRCALLVELYEYMLAADLLLALRTMQNRRFSSSRFVEIVSIENVLMKFVDDLATSKMGTLYFLHRCCAFFSHALHAQGRNFRQNRNLYSIKKSYLRCVSVIS